MFAQTAKRRECKASAECARIFLAKLPLESQPSTGCGAHDGNLWINPWTGKVFVFWDCHWSEVLGKSCCDGPLAAVFDCDRDALVTCTNNECSKFRVPSTTEILQTDELLFCGSQGLSRAPLQPFPTTDASFAFLQSNASGLLGYNVKARVAWSMSDAAEQAVPDDTPTPVIFDEGTGFLNKTDIAALWSGTTLTVPETALYSIAIAVTLVLGDETKERQLAICNMTTTTVLARQIDNTSGTVAQLTVPWTGQLTAGHQLQFLIFTAVSATPAQLSTRSMSIVQL
jgi:hypothetical protein